MSTRTLPDDFDNKCLKQIMADMLGLAVFWESMLKDEGIWISEHGDLSYRE